MTGGSPWGGARHISPKGSECVGAYPLVSLVSLYLLINRVLCWGWCPLAYPFQKGAQTLLPRAPLRSYRERSGVHTESVSALLPRAPRRSYRGRLGVLTESVFWVVVCVLQSSRKRGAPRGACRPLVMCGQEGGRRLVVSSYCFLGKVYLCGICHSGMRIGALSLPRSS